MLKFLIYLIVFGGIAIWILQLMGYNNFDQVQKDAQKAYVSVSNFITGTVSSAKREAQDLRQDAKQVVK